ncbi:hypothetical protein CDAR_540091 [Caerostris darwini]|uniref:Major facilitator superfamily (MFS) profile domain-containing protein n=1 Tax=Caerostris darwini TaxID=1538125 RepID=A0AAV4T2L4_9ARAC|nr:hypothetical protein CDAR_540091 [Caerostris darwini]
MENNKDSTVTKDPSTTSTNDNEEESGCCKCSGVRYLFVISSFLGMCFSYALRVNLSIAIIAMVNSTAISEPNGNTNFTNVPMCGALNYPLPTSRMQIRENKTGTFIWSPKMQGVILGSFYYGYSISQIPGARLAEIYSGKWILGFGIFISALLAFLIPEAAKFHTTALIVVRALQGLAQGVTFPALYNLLGRWTLEEEKTLIESFVVSGINVGTVIGLPLAAKLTNSSWFGGWPAAFYVIGKTPMHDTKELQHITAFQMSEHEPVPIPWLRILTFGPFWAAVYAQFIGDWTFFLLLNNLPTFYSTILNFHIETNGYVSSFSYVLQTIVACLSGFISDEAIKHEIVTPIVARKTCNMLGCIGSIVGLLISSSAGCDITLQICAFGLTMAAVGMWSCSYMISYLDISPEYAGTLIGVSSTFSGFTGFITPIFVGALTDKQPTFSQWRFIFGVTIILIISNGIVYQLFATATKQYWDEEQHLERDARFRNYYRRLFRRKQETRTLSQKQRRKSRKK